MLSQGLASHSPRDRGAGQTDREGQTRARVRRGCQPPRTQIQGFLMHPFSRVLPCLPTACPHFSHGPALEPAASQTYAPTEPPQDPWRCPGESVGRTGAAAQGPGSDVSQEQQRGCSHHLPSQECSTFLREHGPLKLFTHAIYSPVPDEATSRLSRHSQVSNHHLLPLKQNLIFI